MRIHLVFKGMLQSWSGENKWTDTRKTELIPIESAVYGLLACALGVWREDKAGLQGLKDRVSVFVENRQEEASVFTDYQIFAPLIEGEKIPTVNGTGKDRGPIIKKEYLEDTVCRAVIEGEESAIREIAEALCHPVYPYYLGRACCTPSRFVIEKIE